MYTPTDKPVNTRPSGTHPSRSLEEASVASAAGLGAVPTEARCGYDYWLASNMVICGAEDKNVFECLMFNV